MLSDYYLTIKAIHIISFISWMAGMLYLPRLFVYHTSLKPKSETAELFKVMEKRLLRIIINPAMIMTFITGILLLIITEAYKDGWMHGKFLLLFFMFGAHGIMARCRRKFHQDSNQKSERFYRILNEVPTILMIGIVLLVVLKPF